MTILCGIDFSDPSNQAEQVAAHLCQRLGEPLMLAHALDITGYAMLPDIASYATAFAESSRDVLRVELERRTTRLRTRGLMVECQLLDGPADVALVALADQLAPRVIVVGTHGERGVRRMVMGSVAEKVAQSAHHPLLVVNREQTGLVDWATHNNRPLRVLVAIDDSDSSNAAIAWVKDLRTRLPVNVTFVHFYYPPHEHRRFGIRPQLDGDADVVRALHRDLQARMGELPGEGSVALRIYANWVSVAERLSNEVRSTGADLLMLGAHQRSLWARLSEGSVVQQTLRQVEVPILCVPHPTAPQSHQSQIPDLRVVLAATDLSEAGNHAIPYAYALLRGGGGVVQLCHVCADAAERTAVESRLRTLIPADAEMYGIHTQLQVVVDRPVAETLAQLAERLGADAICMRSHGRGTLAKAVLGSTTAEVGKHTRRPVFLVR